MSRIINTKKVNRAIDFQSINFFSDIDLTMEVNGKFLILGEAKEKGKDLTIGQRILMESIVKAWNENPNRDGLALMLSHPDVDGPTIPITLLRVTKWFRNGKWHTCNEDFLEFIENLAKSWRSRDARAAQKIIDNLNRIEL